MKPPLLNSPLIWTAPLENQEDFQRLCRHMVDNPEAPHSLTSLAAMAGLSTSHFQRKFKAALGISPKTFLTACRLETFKTQLRQGVSITDALYEAGFGSSSRVYEKAKNKLGMTPKQYQTRGKGVAISYAHTTISLGLMMMAATDRGLCFLQFGKTEPALYQALQQEFPLATLTPMPPHAMPQFETWVNALESHLQGQPDLTDFSLDIRGTAFQQKVWHALQTIPYGEVRSYTQVAEDIGQPKAARAVASACAANRLAILIPCHRVLRGTGALGGYRWGLDMKEHLLAQEQQFSAATRLPL